jgi:hypothetical protein
MKPKNDAGHSKQQAAHKNPDPGDRSSRPQARVDLERIARLAGLPLVEGKAKQGSVRLWLSPLPGPDSTPGKKGEQDRQQQP